MALNSGVVFNLNTKKLKITNDKYVIQISFVFYIQAKTSWFLIAVSWFPMQQTSVRGPCKRTEVRCLITKQGAHVLNSYCTPHREPGERTAFQPQMVFIANTCVHTEPSAQLSLQSDSL